MAFLALDRIPKRFRRETVLDSVSLGVEAGETVAILGPSGAGKTVLLRLIAGVLDPDQGDIRIDGKSVVAEPPEARKLGMAFQNFALYPHRTTFENIASPLRALGQSEAEIRAGVMRAAELLQIDHVLSHLPKALSNGQKQRASLARSLVRDPKLLLLDDPLRNVDAKLRYEMRIELPRLLKQAEAAVLYVTQDYKEAMALGDRVAILADHGIAQIGSPQQVYRHPASTTVARLLGDPAINLARARPEGHGDGARIEVFGQTLSLPALPAAAIGRDCLVGVRPEHVRVGLTDAEGGQPAELDAVTPLNARSVLLLKTADGGELLASCSAAEAARFPRGHRTVWLRLSASDLMLFDLASGARLAPALPREAVR